MNITILEFTNAKTYIRKVPTEIQHLDGDEILEHFAKELGFRASDAQYIVSDVENFDTDIDVLTAQTKSDINSVVLDGYESALEAYQEEDDEEVKEDHWAKAYNRLEKLTSPNAEDWE